MSHHHKAHSGPPRTANALALGLGGFSIALGLLQLLAPRAVSRSIGLDESRSPLVAGYGLREIGTGIGILTARDPAPWIWGRVAGDALDLLTLLDEASDNSRNKPGLPLAITAVLGVTALDIICGIGLRQSSQGPQRMAQVPDYRGRSGWSRPVELMRGAARDFKVPDDMRIPAAMRPYPVT
jgi:hypothetical protein